MVTWSSFSWFCGVDIYVVEVSYNHHAAQILITVMDYAIYAAVDGNII